MQVAGKLLKRDGCLFKTSKQTPYQLCYHLFAAKEQKHVIVEERMLPALEKQNEHQNVLGIIGKNTNIREVDPCLIPLSMHNLQIINVFIFSLVTYWMEGPGDLLRNHGKKNTRFHLIPSSMESYNIKNTYWKKSAAVQKFHCKLIF